MNLNVAGVTWSVDKVKAAGKSTFIVSGKDKSAIVVVRDGAMKAVKAINKVCLIRICISNIYQLQILKYNHYTSTIKNNSKSLLFTVLLILYKPL